MARDGRKKEKQRLKREKKKQAARKTALENPLRRIAKTGQPLECWVGPMWRQNGLADIFVIGHVPGGSECLAVFLIDLYCVGLKDAYGRRDLTGAQIREGILEPREERGGKLERIDVEQVRRFVAGAIRFSRQNGFSLPAHYERWTAILGDLGDVNNADLSNFGAPDGGLLYIGDLDFLRQRLIASTPAEFISRPDVKFVGGGDLLSELGYEPAFVDEDEEEEDEDALDGVDEDEEEFDDPAMAEMAETMRLISSSLADSVRRWCFAGGKIPSPLIDQAADYTLTRMIIQSASAPSSEGEAPFAALSSQLDDFLAGTSDEARLEMAIAVGQFKDFMQSLSSLDELFQAAGVSKEDLDDAPDSADPIDPPRLSIARDIVDRDDRSRNTSDSSL